MDEQNWTYYFLTKNEYDVYKLYRDRGETMTCSLIHAVPWLRDQDVRMDWDFDETGGLKYRPNED